MRVMTELYVHVFSFCSSVLQVLIVKLCWLFSCANSITSFDRKIVLVIFLCNLQVTNFVFCSIVEINCSKLDETLSW